MRQERRGVLFVVLCFVTLIASGCVTGQYQTTPPTSSKNVEHAITIDKPKDAVWSELVPALAKSFFVVNNIDKDSGFINVGYAGDPEKYVDGGVFHGWVKNLQGRRDYDFPASRSYAKYEVFESGQIRRVERTLTLDGRINMTLEELGAEKTLVTVTAKYILTKSGQVFHLVVDQNYRSTWVPEAFMHTASFTTGSDGYFPGNPNPCRATGLLETEILDLLR
jgi:hypothetical protein